MKKTLQVSAILASVALGVSTGAPAQAKDDHGPNEIITHLRNPYGGGPQPDHPTVVARTAGGKTSNGIDYHGGPVMTAPVNVYYIFYGNWPTGAGSARQILTDFASSLGGSPYWNINTTYYSGTTIKTPVSGSVFYQGSVDDNYSLGALNLSDANIKSIVTAAIGVGPADPNGIYFVLTSADVTKSGFCTSYCGWHTHATIAGSDVKYSFVGNPAQCLAACAAQGTGPNGDAGADAMASIIAHEAEEAATDPDLNAWYDRRGYENADKCAWTFGTTYPAANGALANMKLGTRDFLIQRNWLNANGGSCVLKYP